VRLTEAGVNALIDQNCVNSPVFSPPRAALVYSLAVGGPVISVPDPGPAPRLACSSRRARYLWARARRPL